MADRAEAERYRERLSEKTPQGDAIVRSHEKKNHERLAEMTNLLLKSNITKR
jgi:hypothetical protein